MFCKNFDNRFLPNNVLTIDMYATYYMNLWKNSCLFMLFTVSNSFSGMHKQDLFAKMHMHVFPFLMINFLLPRFLTLSPTTVRSFLLLFNDICTLTGPIA